ncbi:M23 family metallopeptidase [Lewinella cohaerens]|uniref:M23 family metallopeptidase n=1 Tax=Lewinella cohaerens TaxID=70995 RepID=UPI00036E97C9|nr:M23 family metallopeptidase [Lewinella cohaerens]
MNKLFGWVGPVVFIWIVGTQFFDPYTPVAEQEFEQGAEQQITSSEGLRFPVQGHSLENIISHFGDARGKSRTHQGVDIKAPRHTPVLAVIDGHIEAIKEGGNGGRTLYLRGSDGVQYFYAHLEDWLVKDGDEVSVGQEIATVGNSGNASKTIPHLHFEILVGKARTAVDPMPLLENAR